MWFEIILCQQDRFRRQAENRLGMGGMCRESPRLCGKERVGEVTTGQPDVDGSHLFAVGMKVYVSAHGPGEQLMSVTDAEQWGF